MKKQLEELKEFSRVFNAFWQDSPSLISPEARAVRARLMEEELREVIEAMESEPLENTAKELADLLYVVYGTIGAYGLSDKMEAVFDEVHRSNMSKLGADGKPIVREDGKVLKGPNYTPADVARVLTT